MFTHSNLFKVASAAIATTLLIAGTAHAEQKSDKVPTLLPTKKTTTPAPADIPADKVFSTYQAELYETNKAQDAERAAIAARETTMENQADLERQIAQRKAKIEQLKAKQEQISSDMKTMQVEVDDYKKRFESVKGEYSAAEDTHEQFLEGLEKEKSEVAAHKANYETALAQLNDRHDKIQKSINANLIQLSREKTELVAITTSLQSIQAKVAALDADEMKARAEFMAAKAQTEERKADKQKQLALLQESEKKYQVALNDQKSAQGELASAERSLAETSSKVNSEIRKLDDASQMAQRSKLMAETNKVRVEAELEKIHAYASMVKKANSDLLDAEHQSEQNLMTAQLSLEAAKAELATTVGTGEQIGYKRAAVESKSRSIASVNESNKILDEGKQWIVKSSCVIRERPRSASKSLGDLTPGQHIAASVGPGEWVKVLSMGRTAFVRRECGNFEN